MTQRYLPPHGYVCPCGKCEGPPDEVCQHCGEHPTQVWTEEMEELYRVERAAEFAEENPRPTEGG